MLAEALHASRVDIWTDVPGIYTTDPRVVSAAKRIDEIAFAEAAEMATFGAKVLHPATLLPAVRSDIPVFVGSSKDPRAGGTLVCNKTENPPLFRALALRRNQTLLTLHSLNMLHSRGFLAEVFGILARHNISVDLITTSEVSVALTMDTTALMRYLAYEYAPTPQTMYKEVVSLPPAHWLLLEEGRLRLERYWDMPVPDEDETRPVPELCAELRHLLARAVRRRMVSDVPLGVFLSGGIDSTIVAGLMASQSAVPVKTFSIGFSEASYDESRYARLAAAAYGTEHHERVLSAAQCADTLPEIISSMDVPMADASVAPTWLLSGVTREKVTVALGGDGADELWAGYEHYIGFKLAERYNALPAALRRGLVEPLARLLPSSDG